MGKGGRRVTRSMAEQEEQASRGGRARGKKAQQLQLQQQEEEAEEQLKGSLSGEGAAGDATVVSQAAHSQVTAEVVREALRLQPGQEKQAPAVLGRNVKHLKALRALACLSTEDLHLWALRLGYHTEAEQAAHPEDDEEDEEEEEEEEEELRLTMEEEATRDTRRRETLLALLLPHSTTVLSCLAGDTPLPLPLERPPFTLMQLRDAIPKHCFKRDLFKSLSHLASDLTLITFLFYLAAWVFASPAAEALLPGWARFVLWPAYWYAQGVLFTGVWVLAHECGHQAFSDYPWVNNTVGTLCHSMLLVPFHPWRISHGRHHNNTGSMENDEVFVPSERSDVPPLQEAIEMSPIATAFNLFFMFLVGWLPGYLVFNATGPKKYADRAHSHFDPNSAIFDQEQRPLVVQSDVGFFAAIAVLFAAGWHFGALNVFLYYGIPYLVTNYHLILITYLQHTDVFLPHFRSSEWTWLRGALCTVDRSFGPVLDHCFHHISDTHVAHHLFSTMPFYHAQEATVHLRRVLGDYYKSDDTPIGRALWRSYVNCRFVEDEPAVVFHKNHL